MVQCIADAAAGDDAVGSDFGERNQDKSTLE